ncbi:e3 ubiquitin-protein ligase trim [Anaeramoeba flamelloides]|uniref:E3 ubiquitin-protein ligase trim n=1 Tax=Anaeramoeba flamelloides TaxID=1746091 RepID=A0ABQ8YA48_9EUKA|nr:e3 ubiquitin-protein ligase trim [Anaeramoeba flamelloides]
MTNNDPKITSLPIELLNGEEEEEVHVNTTPLPIQPLAISEICEVCKSSDAEYHCSRCSVNFCENCTDKLHSEFLKTSHQKYVKLILGNEKTNKKNKKLKKSTKCELHEKKYLLFCKNDNRCICTECIAKCTKHGHILIKLEEASKIYIESCKQILGNLRTAKKHTRTKAKKSLQDHKNFQKSVEKESKNILEQINFLQTKINSLKGNYLNSLKRISNYNSAMVNHIVHLENEKQKFFQETKGVLQNYLELEKKEDYVQIITNFQKLDQEKINRSLNLNVNENKKVERGEEKEQTIRYQEYFSTKYKSPTARLDSNFTLCTTTSKSNENFWVCGNSIFQKKGIYEIRVKINQFPNRRRAFNKLQLGIVDYQNRDEFIQRGNLKGRLFFTSVWDPYDDPKITHKKVRFFPKHEEVQYGSPLKKGDVLRVIINMTKRELSFGKNDEFFGLAWDNIPEKVCFFAHLWGQKKIKNKISFVENKN